MWFIAGAYCINIIPCVLHLRCEYFYRLPPSLPRYRDRWKGRKRHWNNNKEWCHQACSPRLLALLQPAQVERHLQEVPPPPPPLIIPSHCGNFQLPYYILRMASNSEAVSMAADIGQQQWSRTIFRLSDRILRSRVRIFVIWQELVKFQAAAYFLVAAWILVISWHGGLV